MNIALICGSPRHHSGSAALLTALASYLPARIEITRQHWSRDAVTPDELAVLTECDGLVFAFPLYVDAIPAHLLRCLQQVEGMLAAQPRQRAVYAIANCGFHEALHNELVLEMMAIWCRRSNQHWCGGLGIGAGGMATMAGQPHRPMAPVRKELARLAGQISVMKDAGVSYVSPAFPWLLYKVLGEAGWRRQARKHGWNHRDLSAQPAPSDRE